MDSFIHVFSVCPIKSIFTDNLKSFQNIASSSPMCNEKITAYERIIKKLERRFPQQGEIRCRERSNRTMTSPEL